MSPIHRRALAFIVSIVLGCSSSSPEASSDFPETPLATVKSQDGKLDIVAYTAPEQPPTRGTITVKLEIKDAARGERIDDLTIEMAPEMPSMGHGTPVVPRISGKGRGTYIAEDVNLFMAGHWDLRMTITGAVTDSAVVPIDAR